MFQSSSQHHQTGLTTPWLVTQVEILFLFEKIPSCESHLWAFLSFAGAQLLANVNRLFVFHFEMRRSHRAWRRASLPYLQTVRDAADSLLPKTDVAEAAALQASLNEAAAVGMMPVRGFDVPGARFVLFSVLFNLAKSAR